MKRFLLQLAFVLPTILTAQFAYEGPIPPITTGYGAFGDSTFTSQFFYLAPDTTSTG
jgi:hypothetical protein